MNFIADKDIKKEHGILFNSYLLYQKHYDIFIAARMKLDREEEKIEACRQKLNQARMDFIRRNL